MLWGEEWETDRGRAELRFFCRRRSGQTGFKDRSSPLSLSPPPTVKNMDADVDGGFRLSSPRQRSRTFNKTGFGRRQRWRRLWLARAWHDGLPLENKRLKESECQPGRNLEQYKSKLASVKVNGYSASILHGMTCQAYTPCAQQCNDCLQTGAWYGTLIWVHNMTLKKWMQFNEVHSEW